MCCDRHHVVISVVCCYVDTSEKIRWGVSTETAVCAAFLVFEILLGNDTQFAAAGCEDVQYSECIGPHV